MPLPEIQAKIAEGLEQAESGEFHDGEEVFQELDDLIGKAPSASDGPRTSRRPGSGRSPSQEPPG